MVQTRELQDCSESVSPGFLSEISQTCVGVSSSLEVPLSPPSPSDSPSVTSTQAYLVLSLFALSGFADSVCFFFLQSEGLWQRCVEQI